MKTQHNKRRKTRSSSKSNKSAHENDCFENVNQAAEELDILARRRLPDRVLQGGLTGCEDDVRQEAILLALSWFLRNEAAPDVDPGLPWHAPRAIAGALRIIKRNYLKNLKSNAETLQQIRLHENRMILHPVMIPTRDWPTCTMKRMIKKAIRIARNSYKISASNAAIAQEVLVQGIPVTALAEQLGVSRSAVNQQLSRAKRHLPTILQHLEVALANTQ
jgi:hypothetical protein